MTTKTAETPPLEQALQRLQEVAEALVDDPLSEKAATWRLEQRLLNQAYKLSKEDLAQLEDASAQICRERGLPTPFSVRTVFAIKQAEAPEDEIITLYAVWGGDDSDIRTLSYFEIHHHADSNYWSIDTGAPEPVRGRRFGKYFLSGAFDDVVPGRVWQLEQDGLGVVWTEVYGHALVILDPDYRRLCDYVLTHGDAFRGESTWPDSVTDG